MSTRPETPATDSVSALRRRQEYIDARNTLEGREDLNEHRRATLSINLAAAAILRAQTQGREGYLRPDEHRLNIIRQLAYVEPYINKHAELRDQKASRSERRPYLEKITAFNHSLKEMIDANPQLSFHDVVTFIREQNTEIHGRHRDSEFINEVKAILDGMRHEVGVEQLLGAIPGAEYREASVDDDLGGSDLFVSLDGSPEISIDVKASQFTAKKAQDKARQFGYSADHIVWSHLNDEDFNGGFRADAAAINRAAPLFEKDLRRAIRASAAA